MTDEEFNAWARSVVSDRAYPGTSNLILSKKEWFTMAFKERMAAPNKNNKNFIAKAEGGLNPCVPRPEGSNLPFQNCVFWAVGRWLENYGEELPSMNADRYFAWASAQGMRTSAAFPAPGALAVWGEVNGNGRKHIAVVERVNADGSIVTSESGWNNAKKAVWWTTRKPGGNWGQNSVYKFLGFVIPDDAPALGATLRKGSKGSQVRNLQLRLAGLGYLRKTEVDGDFGKITLGAVCAFQLENGLKVDGIAGPETQSALFK